MKILGYIINMVIPVTLFMIGLFFTFKPATKINNLAGHRTKYSKLSQQTWDYAQRTMAKTYLIVGAIYTIISATVNIILFKQGIKVDELWLAVGVIVLVQCTAPLIEYVIVEKGLKRKFDMNGNIRK
ncbi:SdpI/YhfL protein family protein [Lachnospiraceae bacterium XBB1006]|nr:SdpI/YhfL protein family protein [Lachnospiraceae bacterium XBB1006]